MITRVAIFLLLAIGQTAWAQQYTVSTMAYPNIADAVQVSLDNATWRSSLTVSANTTVYFRFNSPIGYDLILSGNFIETESGSPVSYSDNHFTMPAKNVTVSANFNCSPFGSTINYTVTLSPDEGTGNFIVYYFDPESAAPNASSANNCQFYYVNYNTIGFRLLDSYCPNTFIAPQGCGFNGWDTSGCITLNQGNTTFYAEWGSRYFHLSPEAVTLNGAGYTSITLRTDPLELYGANRLFITFSAGTLNKGTDAIPFYVYSNTNSGPGSIWNCQFHHSGIPGYINVFITDDAYNAAVPGTYTGTLNYISEWLWETGEHAGENVADKSGSILLTLVIPENTFAKTITGYGEGTGGWRLIASPLAGLTNAENVDNLISGNYDLYRFNQGATKEWENYKVHHSDSENPFNALVSGQGYLYANKTTTTLTFTGTPYSGNGEVTITKTDGTEFEGWNLIGNPFSTAATLNKPFYRMNTEGTSLSAQVEANNSVAAMEGVFVQASTNNETASFTQVNNSKGGEKNDVPMLNINLTSNRGETIDNAIIRFDGGQTLGKFTLHEDDSKLYIPQDGKEYAIANAQPTGEMPLNFKASENGSYTLSIASDDLVIARSEATWQPEGSSTEGRKSNPTSFSYLHLIDNLTGNDVDLLQTPNYTFEARTSDYESRFKLVFSVNEDNQNNLDNDDNFAFISDGQLIVNGEGYLQVFDILGRQLFSQELYLPSVGEGLRRSILRSPFSVSHFSPGVYVLRLINDEKIKTQKIIVK